MIELHGSSDFLHAPEIHVTSLALMCAMQGSAVGSGEHKSP